MVVIRCSLAVLTALALIAVTLTPAAARGGCTDVYGNPVIPAGRSITDLATGEMFTCGASGAWEPAPGTVITATPASAPTGQPSIRPRAGQRPLIHSGPTPIALGAAIAAGCTAIGLVLLAARSRRRLSGYLIVEEVRRADT